MSVMLWAEGRASVQRARVQWSASVMSHGLLLNLSLCSCHVASPCLLLVTAGRLLAGPSLPRPPPCWYTFTLVLPTPAGLLSSDVCRAVGH